MRYRFAVILFVLTGCAAHTPKVPVDSKCLLVGTWLSKTQDESGIISRDSNGRFVEKRKVRFSDKNAPGALVGSGTWSVDKRKYSLHYLSVAGDFGQKLVGKTVVADIISLSKNRFAFRFEDSTPVTETKVPKIPLDNIPVYRLQMCSKTPP